MEDSSQVSGHTPRIRRIALIAGLAAFLAMTASPAPAGLPGPAWAVAALAMLMAVWWVTEALPLAATALLPVVLLPLLGVAPIEEAASAYAHPLIFLFLGGFLIANALERWGLHHRVAAAALRLGARGGAGLVGSLMAATAFLSMWISNTAAAMVMAPIALSVARTATHGAARGRKTDELAAAMLLGVAFSATIGGMATLIGTPPNALLAGYLQTAHGRTIGFGEWLLVGLPISTVLLALAWMILTRLVFRLDDAIASPPRPAAPAEALGPGARRTAWIVTAAGLALVLRPALSRLAPGLPLSDAGIVMTAALALFALPAGQDADARLLRWEDARTIRWDVLILFGGGLSLASAMESSGLSLAMGAVFATLDHLPIALVVLLAMIVIVYLGELASNTAMAAIFLPVAGAAAVGLGAAPLDLVLPIGLAASLGFMLPVATPPNAIVYGTGAVTSAQMMRAGAVLDMASIPVVYLFAATIGPVLFGP